jgi:hypothetical protein
LEEIIHEYLEDTKTKKLLTELTVISLAGPFLMEQGIIQFKKRIWLHASSKLKMKILKALHASAIRGHSGFAVTYHIVKR